MIRISSAHFSAPIFALALLSFLPSQAQAECNGTVYGGVDDYTDVAAVDNIICDPTFEFGLDATNATANLVDGLGGNDYIQIGNNGNAFFVNTLNGDVGIDQIIVLDASQVTTINGGDDKDIIHIKDIGTVVTTINGDAGGDIITVQSGATVNTINGGADDDIISVLDIGTIVTSIAGDIGLDTITIGSGAQVTDINGGADKDQITIDGFGTSVTLISADDGDDNLTVQGGSVGSVVMGLGIDIVEVNNNGSGGILAGNVAMGQGNDQFNANGGTIDNGVTISMQDDDDQTQLLGPAQADFSGVIFRGDGGIDTFIAFNYLKMNIGQVNQVLDYELLDLQNSTLRLLGAVYEFDTSVSVDLASLLEFGPNNLVLNTGQYTNAGILDVTGVGAGNFVINFTNALGFQNKAGGRIDMSDNADGDVLTLNGAYAGGGTIDLDVFIGGTGSPADHVVITGAVSNTTGLNVIPTGFDPQLTGTGPGNGIALIDVSAGTTNADDFVLLNGPINAGAFVYDLVLETDKIWYLQSRLDEVFQAFPGMVTAAQQQGDLVQGTLHQRMGDLRHEEEKHPNKNAFQVWMRGFGGHNDVDNDTGRFQVNGGQAVPFAGGFDSTTFGGQGGADYGFADLFTGQDRLHVGVMGYYGHTDVDFGVLPVNGDINGYGGGVYATYIHPNFYVDTSLLAGKLDFETRDNARGSTDSYDGDTLGASIETGVPITLGQFVIEPQLQLTYRDVRFDSFETDTGVRVSSDDGESLKGRAGARFAVNLNPAEGLLVSPYIVTSVVQEFMGDNTVDADNVRLHSDVAGTSFDGGLGVTASFGNAVSLFAETGGSFGEDVDSYRGNLGIRVSW